MLTIIIQVKPVAVTDINFSSKLPQGNEHDTSKVRKQKVAEPTDEEIDNFNTVLNGAKRKPGILKITPPFAEQFVPKMSLAQFPKPLTDLYNPEALKFTYTELLDVNVRNYLNTFQ